LCWLVKVKLFNIFFGYWNIKTLGKFCNLALLKSSGEREMSTTMALNRIMALLVRDKQLGPKVVPIIPDGNPIRHRTGFINAFLQHLPLLVFLVPHDFIRVFWLIKLT
jgi:hypothetical protein